MPSIDAIAPVVDPLFVLVVTFGVFLVGDFAGVFVFVLFGIFVAVSEVLPPAGWADAGAASASINKAMAANN